MQENQIMCYCMSLLSAEFKFGYLFKLKERTKTTKKHHNCPCKTLTTKNGWFGIGYGIRHLSPCLIEQGVRIAGNAQQHRN